MTTLAELQVGQAALVAQVRGADEISLRLLEMGLTPGVGVRLLAVAPLGDPLEIELRGYRLSVRRSEAERIELQPVA